jgi:demethylmenaquinone methyltransferase/2-methoxy-6-polyprenyl-1,4-benzoquinol methylase
MPARGAEPPGVTNEQNAGEAVRSMFNAIAHRYDFLNHLLSFNIDRLWWRRAARSFRPVLQRPNAVVLDLCCGTGDMTMALARHRPPSGVPMLAIDFAHEMLQRGEKKFAACGAIPIEADALAMPVADSSTDLVVSAFGFRNLASYEAGLREVYRVLRPGGELGILDFGEPGGVVGKLYQFYFRRVLPRVGDFLSGTKGPYQYLPRSVHRFPPPQEMLALLRACGFEQTSWTPYTFGVAGLYRAVRPTQSM